MSTPPRSRVLSPSESLARLPDPNGERFVEAFAHGSLVVEFYAPRDVDPQSPHRRDEVYVVVSGRGEFVHGGQRSPCVAGDCLFVAAGVEHRFEHFSEDFGVWVFFYGPDGGESAAPG